MFKIKILLLIISLCAWSFSAEENSKYYYIDSIDKIKDLEEISNKYLELGDTLNAVNALIEIAEIVVLSEIYGDDFIADYLYKIGNLFLLSHDIENAEKYLLLSVDRYNQNKIKNQLLMNDPLISLQKIYNKDSLKLKTISKEIDLINNLEEFSLSDSAKYDMLSFNTFDENILIESEYFIYDNIHLATSSFYNGLYAQAAETLNKSLNTFLDAVKLDYYYNLDVLDSLNIEFLYPAFNLLLSADSLSNNSYFFMSIMNLKLGENEEALTQALKYNNSNLLDSKGYELIGNIYLNNGNWYDALFQYQRTLIKNKNDLDLKLKISHCLIQEEYYQKAVNVLQEIIHMDSSYEEAYYKLANLYLLTENYEGANGLLKQYLLLNPNNKEGYYALGLSYMGMNKYNFALDSFKKVVLLDGLYADAHYYLAVIFESILDYEKSIFHYKQAKRHGCLFKKLNIQYGTLLYNLNYFQGAVNPLQDYLIQTGENVDVLIMLGDIFYQELRYGESIEIYNKLLIQSPENILYKNRLAESFYKLKSYQDAIEMYETILIETPDDINIMMQLGDIYNEIGNYNVAIQFYNSIVECSGGERNVLYKLALSYIETEKFLQSLIVFKRARLLAPNDEIIKYQIGVTYTELGLYQQAIKYFIDYNTNDADSRFMAGFCYYKLEKYQQAIQFFDLYLKIQDNSSEVDYYKGLCYYYLNDFKTAAIYLKKVTKTDKENTTALYRLGLSYLKLNKKIEAKKILNNLYYLDTALHDSLNSLIKQ